MRDGAQRIAGRVSAMDAILVVKRRLVQPQVPGFRNRSSKRPRLLDKGQVDGIGTRPRLRAAAADKTSLIDQTYPETRSGSPAAIHHAGNWLRATQKVDLVAVGHRVVHGGPD